MKKRVMATKPLMRLLAQNTGIRFTYDELVDKIGCARSSLYKVVSVLIENGWEIDKPRADAVICVRTGTFDLNPKIKGLPRRPVTTRGQHMQTKARSHTQALTTGRLAVNDLLEVINVTKAGTILAEDANGVLFRVTEVLV